MERIPRQQYTKEFREQAVRLVLEQQVTIPEAAGASPCQAGRLSAGCVTLGRASSPRWGRADRQ